MARIVVFLEVFSEFHEKAPPNDSTGLLIFDVFLRKLASKFWVGFKTDLVTIKTHFFGFCADPYTDCQF